MNILKLNEFIGQSVNESLDKSVKTVLNVFVQPGWESDYSKMRMNGDYKGSENQAKKLGKDLENFLKGLSQKELENFNGFTYDEKASDPNNMRFEYKSDSPFNTYDLQKIVYPFFENIMKANKDKTTKISLTVVSVGDDGNKVLKFAQDATKPADLKWEDYKGELN